MAQAAVSSTVVYRDPMAALDWLAKAFGFEVSLLLTDAEGNVAHAEMSYLSCGIGVACEWAAPQLGGARMRSPVTLDGQCSQFIGIALVRGLDAHCETARAAGARITEEPADQFYGARSYRAMDPEGHVWTFRQELRKVSTAELEAASGLTYKVGGDA
ncbi:VOC family protein [Phenylobacterium sp.]|uniref:VOC family protein n=1 Tax=Phenylobacterium sp. TaxID=1871053 RepID=UPI0030F3BF38